MGALYGDEAGSHDDARCAAARKALAALGLLKAQEWIVTATFLVMVGLWGAGATLGIDATHLLALFGVFMDVGVKVGVPAMPLALLLPFATNRR